MLTIEKDNKTVLLTLTKKLLKRLRSDRPRALYSKDGKLVLICAFDDEKLEMKL